VVIEVKESRKIMPDKKEKENFDKY